VRRRPLAGGSPRSLRRRGSGEAQQERHEEEKDKGGNEDSRGADTISPHRIRYATLHAPPLERIGSSERTLRGCEFFWRVYAFLQRTREATIRITIFSFCSRPEQHDPLLTNCISSMDAMHSSFIYQVKVKPNNWPFSNCG
jgi:hypothetical protein